MRTPKAYKSALLNAPDLDKRYQDVTSALATNLEVQRLREFEQFIASGSPAINMSLARCVEFFETGKYLNVYEWVARAQCVTGKRLLEEVRKQLGPEWAENRMKVDSLLRFRRNTHYAAHNVNGSGPDRYGLCCVVLKRDSLTKHRTCFAGDSIRVVFDSAGKQILTDAQIAERFGVHDDLHKLAVIKHRADLENPDPGFDPQQFRGILENSDALLEIHIHGPIRPTQVAMVLMSRADSVSLRSRVRQSLTAPMPWPKELDPVNHYMKLVQVLAAHGVPFRLAEAV